MRAPFSSTWLAFLVVVGENHVNIPYIIGRMAMMGTADRLPLRMCREVTTMPIRQLLDHTAFNPEDVTLLRDVFEDTLRALKLVDRSDPVTMLVARTIIELASQGERDPARLRQAAVQAFSRGRPTPT